jgi:hypothetical protein
MTLKRLSAIVGFLLGLGALLLQASITFPLRLANGHDLLDATLFFFTYFTILTNLMLVLTYLSELIAARWLDWWRSPVTRGMMAGAITLVGVFYHFVLAGLWAPEGLAKLADVGLHYATPIFYVLWWVLVQPRGGLSVRNLPIMLLPTALWLAWAMLRGAMIGEYPYPILEANRIGYGQVALNCLVVLAGLVVLFLAVIFYDRAVARRRPMGYSGP